MIRILFICSGNLCRSPLAEALFAKLTSGLPVEVESAGTLNLDGRESPKEVLAVGRRLGVDLREHRAKSINGLGDLDDLDLVIGMAREHMASAVVDHGARPERSFTIAELVQLLDELYGSETVPSGESDLNGEANANDGSDLIGETNAPETDLIGEPDLKSAAEGNGETDLIDESDLEGGPRNDESDPTGGGEEKGGTKLDEDPQKRADAGHVQAEEQARRRIAAANDLRGGTHAFAMAADIPDPIGGPRKGYEAMADTVSDLSTRLVRGLFGPEAVSSSLPEQAD